MKQKYPAVFTAFFMMLFTCLVITQDTQALYQSSRQAIESQSCARENIKQPGAHTCVSNTSSVPVVQVPEFDIVTGAIGTLTASATLYAIRNKLFR